MLKVLTITPMYPSQSSPAFGVFVKSQIDSLKTLADIDLLVLPGLKGLWPYILSIPKIRKKLKNKYDIIHVHFGNASSLIKLLYFGSTPIVTSYCGNDLYGTKLGNPFYIFKTYIYKSINIFLSFRDSYSIVKSKALADLILGRSKKIEIIPNGVDLNRFIPLDKQSARKKLGIPEFEKNVVLFPADPQRPGKNFNFIRNVLSQFDNKHSYKLLVFNEGKVDPELIPYYFYSSDLVVFPSLSEGSPNVIKEAMACNCHIFSSNCGDVPVLLDSVTGAKILPLNEDQWANALEDFFSGRLATIIPNGRDRLIHLGLDIVSIADRVISIYKNALTNKGA